VFVGTGAAGCFLKWKFIHRVVVDCLFMSKSFFLFFFYLEARAHLIVRHLGLLEISLVAQRSAHSSAQNFNVIAKSICSDISNSNVSEMIVRHCKHFLRLVPGSATVH